MVDSCYVLLVDIMVLEGLNCSPKNNPLGSIYVRKVGQRLLLVPDLTLV